MPNNLFQAERVDPLKILKFGSEEEYAQSSLFAAIKPLILERDNHECEYRVCRNHRMRPATKVVFLHRVLAAYLGVGPANLVSVCSDCAALDFPPQSMFFALSGIRIIKGMSRPEISSWYGKRRNRNRETARAVLSRLGEKNRRTIERLIEKGRLAEFYREYLGIS